MPHPGFPTDMQPQIATVLSLADGTSIVTEGVWDSRFRYVEQLTLMGADIQVDGKTITTSTLDTGVSYIENFAKHFNLPVRKLLQIASEVNPNYDYDFASEMMERFELDGKKKFHHLSLGMKTMVSTIICLASNKSVVLLDEPVLGFDAIMRVEFYDMLTESFRKHSRMLHSRFLNRRSLEILQTICQERKSIFIDNMSPI